MKKITQVLYSGLGGHGTVAFALLNGFVAYKNSFIFYGIEAINKAYKEELNTKNIPYFGIIKKKIDIKGWIQYYKYLKKIKPDIILLHSNQLILISYLYNIFNNVKIITVEHDSISIRTKFKWIISNLNAVFANNIIVLSKTYKKHIYSNLWFKSLIKKYKIIPNGIDTKKFNQKENYFKSKTITLFMASRMNKLRDHHTLIKAVALIAKNNPHIKLNIAGDGDTLNELKTKFNKYSFINFLGNINQQEIIENLHNADIYIHATFAETFSTAILQAMSCGLPIITSNIEGTRHMIAHDYNGLLYKSKDIQDLQSKIISLIEDKNKAIYLGNNARKDVELKYNNDIVTTKYLELFN